MIEICGATPETAGLLFTIEDRRLDSERAVVKPKVGGFVLTYKPLPGSLWRVGNAEREAPGTAEEWLSSAQRDAYLGWLDGALAGQVLVEATENNLACVRDIRVAMAMRRRGVGEALVSMAEEWARRQSLGGLVAETQDVNAGACQFLSRCGFELGGVDALRYVARSRSTIMAVGMRETALFFYKFFR